MSDPIFPSSGAAAGFEDKTMVLVVYVLYLLGLVTGGTTTLIGVVMAYMLRGGAGALASTHYLLLIRTFWGVLGWMTVAGLVFAVGLVLSVVLIGIPLLVAASVAFTLVVIWYAVRCILGLVAALQDQPYGRPSAWLL